MSSSCGRVHRKAFVAATVLLLNLSNAFGQTGAGVGDSVVAAQSGIYPLPIVFFTPETGLAGGAAALYLYRDPLEPRASSVTSDIIYTAKQQIIAEINGDVYLHRGSYRVQAYGAFKKFPYKFYGIGNATAEQSGESYTAQSFVASLRIDRNIISHFHAGPLFRLEKTSMKEIEPAGTLATGTITGSRGGTSVGLGLGAGWDSRDNTFASASGSLYEVYALAYRRAFGSDFSFTDLQMDARKFFEVTPGQVLAVQAAGRVMSGTAPFQNMATFGGAYALRGYFEGRYRDDIAVGLQAEYRVHVWWRFGLAAFAGAAQVASKAQQLALGRCWCAGGLGFRYLWNPEERINIRVDYGIGNNSDGVYVTVNEAF